MFLLESTVNMTDKIYHTHVHTRASFLCANAPTWTDTNKHTPSLPPLSVSLSLCSLKDFKRMTPISFTKEIAEVTLGIDRRIIHEIDSSPTQYVCPDALLNNIIFLICISFLRWVIGHLMRTTDYLVETLCL